MRLTFFFVGLCVWSSSSSIAGGFLHLHVNNLCILPGKGSACREKVITINQVLKFEQSFEINEAPSPWHDRVWLQWLTIAYTVVSHFGAVSFKVFCVTQQIPHLIAVVSLFKELTNLLFFDKSILSLTGIAVFFHSSQPGAVTDWLFLGIQAKSDIAGIVLTYPIRTR